MKHGYSTDIKGVKARGKELSISPKKSYELANAIRGKPLEKAKKYLEMVIHKETPVPYKRYDWNIPHRKGMAAGRYPVKTAKGFLSILKSAEANAKSLSIPSEKLRVTCISASKGRPIIGRRKGSTYNTKTTNLEVVLGE